MTQRKTFAAVAVLLFAMPLAAAERTVLLDENASRIQFSLGATAHTVRGSFEVMPGQLQFDPESGKISGEIVADATSGDTGNKSRDAKMHKDVLESAKFPRIVFRPASVEGSFAPSGESAVKVRGVMSVHGKKHTMVIPATVTIAGNRISARASFDVPYVAWGLEDPSVLVIRVAKKVRVDVLLHGTLLN